jgi:hypothetical protein
MLRSGNGGAETAAGNDKQAVGQNDTISAAGAISVACADSARIGVAVVQRNASAGAEGQVRPSGQLTRLVLGLHRWCAAGLSAGRARLRPAVCSAPSCHPHVA